MRLMAGAGSEGQVQVALPVGVGVGRLLLGALQQLGNLLLAFFSFPPGEQPAELESHGAVGFLGPLCWFFWVPLLTLP